MSYSLSKTEQGIALTLDSQAKWRPYKIDFQQGTLRYRYEHMQGKSELIARAIGWKKGDTLHVVDSTAGLGREAFLLAALGCQVTLFERHPTIAILLKDALDRATKDPDIAPVIKRMTFIESCAIQYLQQNPEVRPDVIYCDPMFPSRHKSALVKKDMQLLQTVVGCDDDGSELVAKSLATARKRVVVKRAISAAPLHENPSITFTARSHRFDVYLL